MSERACRDCGFIFTLDDAWWTSSGLALPTRCPGCRAARRQVRIEGAISYYNDGREFGFIAGDDGRRYFFDREDFGLETATPARGLRLDFMPTSAPRGPRARRLRLVGSSERTELA